MEAIHDIIIYFQIFQTPFEVKNLFETGSREMYIHIVHKWKWTKFCENPWEKREARGQRVSGRGGVR